MSMGGTSGGGWILVGAALQLHKTNDLATVKALFVDTAMLTNECANIPKSKLREVTSPFSKNEIATCDDKRRPRGAFLPKWMLLFFLREIPGRNRYVFSPPVTHRGTNGHMANFKKARNR